MVEMMHRGEVWTANLNPPRGREIGKIRPVVILQTDKLGGDLTPMVVVLPMTTKVYPTFKVWRVNVPARDRLLKPCQVVTDQPRALDRTRIGDGPLTGLTPTEMAAVEKSLKAVLGIL